MPDLASLPAATSANTADLIPATQGSSGPMTGTTRNVTVGQIGVALGLGSSGVAGTMTQQSANAVAITGGTVSGADLSAAVVKATGGTVARTLASRSAGRLNVKDFGAKGDGSTDDTGYIQAAINYAAANPLGTDQYGPVYPAVCFDAGTYVHTGLTHPGMRIGMFADVARSVVLFLKSGSNTSNLVINPVPSAETGTVTNYDYPDIRNLIFDGNASGQTGGPSYGIYLPQPTYATNGKYIASMHSADLMILNHLNDGLLIGWNRGGGECKNLICEHNAVLGGGNGVTNNSYDWCFYSGGIGVNGLYNSNSGYGYRQAQGGATTFFATNFYANGGGFCVANTTTDYIDLFGCSIDRNQSLGMYVDQTSATDICHVTMHGGQFYMNSAAADGAQPDISLNNCAFGITLDGVVFRNASGANRVSWLVAQFGTQGPLRLNNISITSADGRAPYVTGDFEGTILGEYQPWGATGVLTRNSARAEKNYAVGNRPSGSVVQMAQGQQRYFHQNGNSGVTAALTIELPPNPIDGQLFEFIPTKGVTTLTVQDSAGSTADIIWGGGPGLAAGLSLKCLYLAAYSDWLCWT